MTLNKGQIMRNRELNLSSKIQSWKSGIKNSSNLKMIRKILLVLKISFDWMRMRGNEGLLSILILFKIYFLEKPEKLFFNLIFASFFVIFLI